MGRAGVSAGSVERCPAASCTMTTFSRAGMSLHVEQKHPEVFVWWDGVVIMDAMWIDEWGNVLPTEEWT